MSCFEFFYLSLKIKNRFGPHIAWSDGSVAQPWCKSSSWKLTSSPCNKVYFYSKLSLCRYINLILVCSESCCSPAVPSLTTLSPPPPPSIFAVSVRVLGHRVLDRREDVQHEDHGRHQAGHEEDRSRTGSPSTQKPRPERRPGGGVWRELSWRFAWQRQGRAETTLTYVEQRTPKINKIRNEETAKGGEDARRDFHTGGSDGAQMDPQLMNVQFLFLVFYLFIFSEYDACCRAETRSACAQTVTWN